MTTETEPVTEPTAPAAKALTAADFRARRDVPRRTEEVSVPALGGVVHVRELSALEKDRLDDALTDERGKPVPDNVRAKVFAVCACTADGAPLFPFDPATVAEIGSWPLSIVDPVYDAAMRVNRFRASDRAAEKKS